MSIANNELTISQFNVAALVRICDEGPKNGLTQRDAAVRAGAEGATTIVYENGKLIIPTVSSDLSESFPELSSQLTQALAPNEGDLIIIGSGKDFKSAEYGALAAAWTLI